MTHTSSWAWTPVRSSRLPGSTLWQYELFGICITLLILVAGGLLLRNTRRLLISRQVLRDAVDAISQGIVMVDARGRLPVINRRASELLGIPHMRVHWWRTCFVSPQDIETLLRLNEAMLIGPISKSALMAASWKSRPTPLDTGGVVRTYADITERKRADAQIIHLAMHDSLTGLPNRRLLADRLGEAVVQRAQRRARWGSAPRGPRSVQEYQRYARPYIWRPPAAGRGNPAQRSIARSVDLAARIGGDEFCVLQSARGRPLAPEALACEMVRRLSEPYQIDGQEVLLSASVGIARYPADGSSVDQLLTNADTAMYRAKEDAAAPHSALYEPAMDVRSAEQRLLEQDLRDALGLEQLTIVYQPIFDIASCEITGFEALLRWFHPTRGAISPEEFIPSSGRVRLDSAP